MKELIESFNTIVQQELEIYDNTLEGIGEAILEQIDIFKREQIESVVESISDYIEKIKRKRLLNEESSVKYTDMLCVEFPIEGPSKSPYELREMELELQSYKNPYEVKSEYFNDLRDRIILAFNKSLYIEHSYATDIEGIKSKMEILYDLRIIQSIETRFLEVNGFKNHRQVSQILVDLGLFDKKQLNTIYKQVRNVSEGEFEIKKKKQFQLKMIELGLFKED